MKKLYRSYTKHIGGVCGGLGEFSEIDPTIIRILFVFLIFTPFPIIILYLFCWAIIPKRYYD